MMELKNNIPLDAADPTSVHACMQALADHIGSIRQDLNALACVLGIAVSLQGGSSEVSLRQATDLALDAAFKLQLGGDALNALKVSLASLDGPTPPPDGGTRLRIVRNAA